jgi:hypothetical protein
MITARRNGSVLNNCAVLNNGSVLFAGGFDNTYPGNPITAAEIYVVSNSTATVNKVLNSYMEGPITRYAH